MIDVVSVIVPLYNCEKTIKRCIESVLNQTYNDWELILINNASTDNTVKIIEEYDDERIFIFNEEKRGVSNARNCGIEHSNGEYLTFIDSDDYVELTFLEEMMSRAKDCGLVICNYLIENSAGIYERDILPMFCKEYWLNGNEVDDYLTGDFGKSIAFSVWNKLFKADVIKNNGIKFYSDVKIGEDKIFVLSYLLENCKKVNLINKSLYHYIIESGSAMNNNNTDYLIEYEKTIGRISEIIALKDTIKDRILAKEAMENIVIALGSGKITRMKYIEFKEYLKVIFYNSNQYKLVVKNGNKFYGFKRRFLKRIFRYKLSFVLYMAVKVNFG